MKNGTRISDEINVADAHPSGRRPFQRKQYIKKFESLTEGLISAKESQRFLEIVQNLRKLKPSQLSYLNLKTTQKKNTRKSAKNSIFS